MTHKLTFAALALAAATAAQAEPTTYQIDPSHTFVTFEVVHYGTSTVRGRFDKKEGTVQFDRAAKTGKVELTIDIASISTGVEAFNGQLVGERWFKATEFPSATFTGD